MQGILKKMTVDVRNKYRLFRNEVAVVKDFLEWAVLHTDEGCGVIIDLRTQKKLLVKKAGSLVPTRVKNTPIHFILTIPPPLNASTNPGNSVTLFISDWWMVVEYPQDIKQRVRYGLGKAERAEAVEVARTHLQSFLQGETMMSNPTPTPLLLTYLQEPVSVDVMLWVSGEMRGSIITKEDNLITALRRGVEKSARDGRFKPISVSELSSLRLEINILSDLQLRLIPYELGGVERSIKTHNGYTVVCGQRRGWYLPVIFNLRRYKNLYDLLVSLAIEKTNIQRVDLLRSRFYTFQIETFIEAATPGVILDLRGSLSAATTPIASLEDFLKRAPDMADWLLKLQEYDGYIPLKADPYTSLIGVTDWTRMAFAGYGLAYYGKHTDNPMYRKAAELTARYISNVYDELQIKSIPENILVLVYLGHLAHTLDDQQTANKNATRVQELLQTHPQTSALLLLQVAAFFSDAAKVLHNDTLNSDALFLTNSVLEGWESALSQGKEISLAEYAELLPLFKRLSKSSDSKIAAVGNKVYQQVRAWYIDQQAASGAFPNTTRSQFTYTRGTGKIVEALSVDPANDEICLTAIKWIVSLQYHDDALFNIRPELAPCMRGSIMHDETNHEAWTDSVAHVLIAAGNIVQWKR